MHRRQRLSALAATLAFGALATGCARNGVVATSAPHASETGCAQLAQRWPGTVAGEQPRPVGHPKAVAAWGDPPIIARCGVELPPPSTDCVEVNGVDWVVSQLSDGRRYVTYGRWPAVEVLVPETYPGDAIAAFSASVQHLPQRGERCS